MPEPPYWGIRSFYKSEGYVQCISLYSVTVEFTISGLSESELLEVTGCSWSCDEAGNFKKRKNEAFCSLESECLNRTPLLDFKFCFCQESNTFDHPFSYLVNCSATSQGVWEDLLTFCFPWLLINCISFLEMPLQHFLGMQVQHIVWLETIEVGTSLAVQWLGCHTSTAEGIGSIPGQGSKTPYTLWHNQE